MDLINGKLIDKYNSTASILGSGIFISLYMFIVMTNMRVELRGPKSSFILVHSA